MPESEGMRLSDFWTRQAAIRQQSWWTTDSANDRTQNFLFAKTEAEAEANAIWYTFIQTAKLNHLKVREYLEHLLSAFAWTESPVWEPYLPWAPEIQRKFRIR